MWLRCGHFDNRPLASLESNHVVAMKQCSHVDSPSTSRKISFAGRLAVAGKSEKKTQRRINSSRFTLPPPMSVNEETSYMDSQQQPSRHRQQDSRKKQMLSPNLTTDGAGRTKVPTKTGRFWAWVSAHQETVWKVEDCLQLLQVEWFDSWRWLHYVEDEDDMVCHTCTRPHITHQLATLMIDAAFFATWNIPVSPGSCREMHHPSRHDQECRRAHNIYIIIARKG